MKAIFKNGKLIIQKYSEANEIEQLILGISKELDRIKLVCEDRNSELFPSDAITRLVDKINTMKTLGKNTPIYYEYFDHLVQNKEIVGFFKKKIDEANKNLDIFAKKRQLFKEFAKRLEKE